MRPRVIITSPAGPKLAHTVIKSGPYSIPRVRNRAFQFHNVCYDTDRFCRLDFPATPCESEDVIFLLTESRQAIRTSKFDPRAPVVPFEYVRFQTAPSPANIHYKEARRGIDS